MLVEDLSAMPARVEVSAEAVAKCRWNIVVTHEYLSENTYGTRYNRCNLSE